MKEEKEKLQEEINNLNISDLAELMIIIKGEKEC